MSAAPVPWIGLLTAAPRTERAGLLEDLVAGRFRTALLMEETDPVPLDQNYFDFGLNSLGAVEIEQYLRAMLGRPIDTATILNNPTLRHLLAYLRTEVLSEFFPDTQQDEPTSPGADADGDPAAAKAILDGLLKELYEA